MQDLSLNATFIKLFRRGSIVEQKKQLLLCIFGKVIVDSRDQPIARSFLSFIFLSFNKYLTTKRRNSGEKKKKKKRKVEEKFP